MKLARCVATICCLSLGLCYSSSAQELPSSRKLAVQENTTISKNGEHDAAHAAALGSSNSERTPLEALNDAFLTAYRQTEKQFKADWLTKHNLIVTTDAGSWLLYRHGYASPIEAPGPHSKDESKDVVHLVLTMYALLAPYCDKSLVDSSWKSKLMEFRILVKNSLDYLPKITDMSPGDCTVLKDSLGNALRFIDKILNSGSYTREELTSFFRDQAPYTSKLVLIGFGADVKSRYKTLEEWRQLLGEAEWNDNTYAVCAAIPETRQHNVGFTILVQFFGEKAINRRLILYEVLHEKDVIADTLVSAFLGKMFDRQIGEMLYGSPYILNEAFQTLKGHLLIERAEAAHGRKAILAPLVPFDNTGWPWNTDTRSGTGPATIEDLLNSSHTVSNQ